MPFEILTSTSWFKDTPNALKEALGAEMTKEEVEDGHVLIWEGSTVECIIIIEDGCLIRSKAVDQGTFPASVHDYDKFFDESSVFVDELVGRGCVTGMFHVMDPDHGKAYATVRSKGPSIIWKIPAEKFLDVLSSNIHFAMAMLRKTAFQVRVGSKSLPKLLKNASKTLKKGKSSVNDVVKVLCYDNTQWVKVAFEAGLQEFNQTVSSSGSSIQIDYTNDRLSEKSATYAAGYDAVCLFVNDSADANVLRILSMLGVKLVAMRCAGYDRIDLKSAKAHGITVVRVPAYSPYAVAEHAISLLMAINRKIPAASTRVKMLQDFTLDNSLLGMDIYNKTVGVMGTGKIGQILCKILNGFGANLICYDVFESDEVKKLGGKYVSKDKLYEDADVIFLMMPLLPATKHTINDDAISKMKQGVLLINTARGGLLDTKALLKGIQSGKIGGVGLDVLENEADYFFQDWSAKSITDADLTSLLGNNRVVLTAHQAFFTKEAIGNIVDITLDNIKRWSEGVVGSAHPNSCIKD